MPKCLDADEAAFRLVGMLAGDLPPEPPLPAKNAAAVELGRLGGQVRARKLGVRKRRAIAKAAAAARWGR